ncbi:MAG: prepilin-type N-terminal cleavage/methylation domain-containing protein [Actinobacteria bacterium]|nr:prepilin-type N-terminal cleavage/methylation domain-containing protein [Actinomycetota bacterium]MBU4179227.1 prepilin-type N-terminal cleavage/methylation domain-containing protein [Actinomycetota bacterium]MBU4218943.1 prepilin-type N-terminal cleavage/methylation domain-containing protein [Actinomycetota bacterium]MBU4357964.1 prepilin-type N-terminal cleavage/methylation domain-containing protein [Actinomycetota bacterium]MBU4391106.1 prepilin-type N-terminal cleavage/methylation domain
MHKSKGFTLIELMIVILIIAILVGIAIPVYLQARRNAQKRTCQANLRTIEGAINTYYADAELYPLAGAINAAHAMVTGSYRVLKNPPECPTNGTLYTLVVGDPPTVACPDLVAGHAI